MGGSTCLGLALERPNLVQALVLADTSGGIADPDMLADFARRAHKLPVNAANRALSENFRRQQPEKTFLYSALGAIAPPPRETFADFLTDASGPAPSQVATVKAPTLVIVGAQDMVISPGNAETVAKCIPGAQLKIVPDAGHSVYFERPDIFNELVGEFLLQCGE